MYESDFGMRCAYCTCVTVKGYTGRHSVEGCAGRHCA